MGAALGKCWCLQMEVPCPDCDNCSGKCRMCDGKGVIIPKHDSELFSYILDKKGAYRDVRDAPKECTKCGGWGGVPLFRGINPSVSPAGSMQGGLRGRMGEHAPGDGVCRRCKGRGTVRVPPDWLAAHIAAHSPSKFEVPGPLMTSPQKAGPLVVPGARRW